MMNQLNISTQLGGLGGLNLSVQVRFQNNIIIISGENGAGKTTLLRCIAGLEQASGCITIKQQLWLDSEVHFSLPVEKRGVGFVWADAVLLPWLNAARNIKLGVNDDDNIWFERICALLEVSHLLKRTPSMLSTGEAQRIALARAMYRKPCLLLLDEPFSAQAPEIRNRLRQALQILQKELNIAVLMVSHDMEDAKILAQQHWHMRQGKLILGVSAMSLDAEITYSLGKR